MIESGVLPPNSNVTSFVGQQAPKATTESDIPKVQTVQQPKEAQDAELQNQQRGPEDRVDTIKRAARQFATDTFVVSDTRFTIYKSLEGGEPIYFTRFTSLKDGSVTIVPDKQLFTSIGQATGTLLELSS